MNAKTIYKILAHLLGYGLIIGGFIIFGDAIETKTRVMDIIISCLIYTQLVEFTIFPMVNLGQKAHKEVGMMGLHYSAIYLYSVLAIGIMVAGVCLDLQFKYQLMMQLVALFVLLIGRAVTLHTGDRVQRIHDKEQGGVESKDQIISAMEDFMDRVGDTTDLNPSALQSLQSIKESLRFLTPSSSAEAKALESSFCQKLADIEVLLRNTSLNAEQISSEVRHLQQILNKRKKF